MQFKKHFSSHLKNLAVKNTYVMPPPPRLDHNYSLSSDTNTDRINTPLVKHRHYSSVLAAINDNNKENQYGNPLPLYKISDCLSSSRKQSTERNKYQDSGLSFNKIKQGLVDAEELCNLKINSTKQQNVVRKSNYQMGSTLPNQSSSMLQIKNKSKSKGNSVRMGSMLFSSLSRGGDKKISNNISQNMNKSQSYDRFKQMAQSKVQYEIECLNNDCKNAKYKVRSQNQNDELLYYCFECAAPLVKQGFEVDLLTSRDKKSIIKQRGIQSYSKNHQKNSQRLSDMNERRVDVADRKAKIGEQIKCRIIMRINKLKVQKEEFNSNIQRYLENIDYFYKSLISHIEQHRINQRQEIIRLQKIQKTSPENYENKLSSSLGNLDYMVRHLQTVNYDYLRQAEAILDQDISYPKIRQNLQPSQGFQRKIEEFSTYFDRNIKLNLQERQQIGNVANVRRSQCRTTSEPSQSLDRSSSLRFSFQQALQQSRKNKTSRGIVSRCYQMNPLQQQNESQLQQSVYAQPSRKDAFRNLFPEEEQNEEQLSLGKHSPVFKQF